VRLLASYGIIFSIVLGYLGLCLIELLIYCLQVNLGELIECYCVDDDALLHFVGSLEGKKQSKF
jgi:hypothetical protein